MKIFLANFIFLMFFISNKPSDNFVKLICDYDFNSLSVVISKKDLKQGFKRIKEIECAIDEGLSTIIFLYNQEPRIFKSKDFDQIPKFVSKLRKGDLVELTLIFSKSPMMRRNKMIKIN